LVFGVGRIMKGVKRGRERKREEGSGA